jgi:hypothetical protein
VKTFTINGKRYTLRSRSYDSHLTLTGPDILGGMALSTDITFETPNLRERVISSIEAHKQCRRNASEYIQKAMKSRTLGGLTK